MKGRGAVASLDSNEGQFDFDDEFHYNIGGHESGQFEDYSESGSLEKSTDISQKWKLDKDMDYEDCDYRFLEPKWYNKNDGNPAKRIFRDCWIFIYIISLCKCLCKHNWTINNNTTQQNEFQKERNDKFKIIIKWQGRRCVVFKDWKCLQEFF